MQGDAFEDVEPAVVTMDAFEGQHASFELLSFFFTAETLRAQRTLSYLPFLLFDKENF